jgi:hypothetical protein
MVDREAGDDTEIMVDLPEILDNRNLQLAAALALILDAPGVGKFWRPERLMRLDLAGRGDRIHVIADPGPNQHPGHLPLFRVADVENVLRLDDNKYSKELGVTVQHTNTTFKPAGTTSKLFGLTEGAHPPSMREFIRWVQFRNDDPLVKEYEEKGYPIKRLKQYEGTTVVGFPTKL